MTKDETKIKIYENITNNFMPINYKILQQKTLGNYNLPGTILGWFYKVSRTLMQKQVRTEQERKVIILNF